VRYVAHPEDVKNKEGEGVCSINPSRCTQGDVLQGGWHALS
jgi:hypothetical protein